MKKIFLLWILLFAFQIFGQNNIALKFDEFSDYPIENTSYYSVTNYPSEKRLSFNERAERFGKKMKRESKNKNAVIVYYNQRKGKYPSDKGKYLAERVANELVYFNNQINKERVILIDGGYREYPTLEFWIVPKDAELPKPTPTFNKNEIVYCPDFYVAGDGFRKERSEPLKFSVAIRDAAPETSLALEWSISSGKITKGQNTNQIEVDLSGTDTKYISASVTAKGLHPECNNHKFASTQVGFYPYKIDEFSHLYYSDMQVRMENLRFYLGSEPLSTGYIIIYGNRNENKKDVKRLIESLNKVIDFGRYDRNRIKMIEGGFRDEMMVEIYLVPAGAEPPKPTPTIDSIFVVEPKKVIKRRARISK